MTEKETVRKIAVTFGRAMAITMTVVQQKPGSPHEGTMIEKMDEAWENCSVHVAELISACFSPQIVSMEEIDYGGIPQFPIGEDDVADRT